MTLGLAQPVALQRAASTAVTTRVDPARVATWRRVQRLLAVRADNIGDVLMTTPALAAATSSVPGLRITLLGGPAVTALRPHLPMVEHVISAPLPGVRHADGDCPDADLQLIAALKRERFDAAIVFTVCTQSALPAAMLCRLAGIPLRLAHVRENPYHLLSDWIPEPDLDLAEARHEVRRQLDLVGQIGWRCADERLRFALLPRDVERAAALLGRARPPLVVVHVGASAASRRWPAERFGAAADGLIAAAGVRIVFTGSRDEMPLVAAARAQMRLPSHSVAGQLSLGELAAVLRLADVVVTNNSGPAHLAAAVGTPVVDLYALTNPQHTPWRVGARVLSHDVPCRNCLKSSCPQGHHLCLRGVSPQRVVAATLDLLRSGAGRARFGSAS